MIEIKDTVTNVFSNSTNDSLIILTYIDIKAEHVDRINKIKDKKIEELVENYPILKQEFIVKDNCTSLEDIPNFNVKDYYSTYEDTDFDKYADILINSQFKQKAKWEWVFITSTNKCRLYFKIDHKYADGYKLIDMLISLCDPPETKHIFENRTTSFMKSLYYIIFGTVIVFINSMSVFIDMFFSKVETVSDKIELIRCKSFSLSEIRRIAKEANITVNEFLYSLMIRTDYLYLNKKRDVITLLPLNNSGVKYNNNMIPIFNKVSNNLDKESLFTRLHEICSSYKYSLYIPILTFIINNIPLIVSYDILAYFYSRIIKTSDYIFTNMIGPKQEIIGDIHFLTKPTYKEVIFNIISSNDNMNIICSFKEGVINKERFEQCIYKAYEQLTQANTESDEDSK
jgi:hypothetical protein